MTKTVLFLFALSLGLTLTTQAHKDHSAEVCSAINAKVCAHVGHMKNFTSKSDAEFIAHVMTPKNEPVSNFKAELWMPAHGHGSTPLKIVAEGENKYKITNASFSLTGEWQIKMNFEFQKMQHEIIVPVVIAK